MREFKRYKLCIFLVVVVFIFVICSSIYYEKTTIGNFRYTPIESKDGSLKPYTPSTITFEKDELITTTSSKD